MSHLTVMKLQVENQSFMEFLQSKGIAFSEGDFQFYSGNITGLGFRPSSKWYYPVVLTKDGELCYDDYEGYWGDRQELEQLLQDYFVHRVLQTAAMSDLSVEQVQQLEDGSVEILLEVRA